MAKCVLISMQMSNSNEFQLDYCELFRFSSSSCHRYRSCLHGFFRVSGFIESFRTEIIRISVLYTQKYKRRKETPFKCTNIFKNLLSKWKRKKMWGLHKLQHSEMIYVWRIINHHFYCTVCYLLWWYVSAFAQISWVEIPTKNSQSHRERKTQRHTAIKRTHR